MKGTGSGKLQLKWKKGEPGNSQQGKNENSIRPPSAGLLERKVLSFHDSSIEFRSPTSFEFSTAQQFSAEARLRTSRISTGTASSFSQRVLTGLAEYKRLTVPG